MELKIELFEFICDFVYFLIFLKKNAKKKKRKQKTYHPFPTLAPVSLGWTQLDCMVLLFI
jgi:hypothetical protein